MSCGSYIQSMSDDTVHKVHEGVICWRHRNCHLGWEVLNFNPLIVNTEHAIVWLRLCFFLWVLGPKILLIHHIIG